MLSMSNFHRSGPRRSRSRRRRRKLKYSTSFLVVALIVVIILICQSILIPTLLLEFQLDQTTSAKSDHHHHHNNNFLFGSLIKNSKFGGVRDNGSSSSSGAGGNKGVDNTDSVDKNNNNISLSSINQTTTTAIQAPIYSSWLHYNYDPKTTDTAAAASERRRRRQRLPLMMLKTSTTTTTERNSSSSSSSFDITTKIIQVRNSWNNNLTRYVCGNVAIPPNSTVTIDLTSSTTGDCSMKMLAGKNKNKSSSNNIVSSSIPILTSVYPHYGILKKQPPTTVRFEPTKQFNNATPIGDGLCDIPCHIQPVRPATIQFKGRIDDLPFLFDPISMEGAGYFTTFKIDPIKWKFNQYYATTSFESDIILSYYLPFDTNLQSQPPVDFNDNEVLRRASFLAKNCESANKRERVIRLMMNYYHTNPKRGIQIDSLSNCLANANFPLGINRKNKTQILRKYLFHLAFENQCYPDYISEKLWHVLESGTLPIYWGPPNIRDHLPSPNSVILYDDFNNDPIALSKYLYKVANNQTLYESYHHWRTQPLRRQFIEKYNFTYTHATCRFCRWGYAKKYGLGWSQPKQQLTELHINRQTCISKTTGLIVRPFQEVQLLWDNDNGEGKTTKHDANDKNDLDCAYSNDDDDDQLLPFYRKMNSYGNGWQRIVYDHDGITDIRLEYIPNRTTTAAISNDRDASGPSDSTTVLRLIMPIQSKELYTPPHIDDDDVQYWLQDDQSRITILLSRPLRVQLQQTELMIYLPHSSLKQQQQQQQELKSSSGNQEMVVDLRLIVEDLDLFHKDATDYESYFGATMARDFFDPLDIIQL